MTARSLVLYPLRRRLPSRGYGRLDVSPGLRLVGGRDDPVAGLLEDVWAMDVYRLAEAAIQPGDTVVDIGANIGVFAVLAATRNPDAAVACVEPSPRALPFLEENLRANGIENVRVIRSACAGKTGVRELYRRGASEEDSLYGSGEPWQQVQAMTLDEVFDAAAIHSCALLKLDCEGAEYEIFLDGNPTVLDRVRAVAIEYHLAAGGARITELERFLRTAGFNVELNPSRDFDGGYLYARRC